MENKPTYRDRIQGLLTNPPEKVIVQKQVEKKEEVSVKAGERIKSIFKMEESVETPSFVTEDLKEDLHEGKYFIVKTPSSYTDVDKYWGSVRPTLRKMGFPLKYSPHKEHMFECTMNLSEGDEILEVFPVRDAKNNEKPGLYFKFKGKNTIDESHILPELRKHGFKWEEDQVKRVADGVVVHAYV